jgi:hypothetical protein
MPQLHGAALLDLARVEALRNDGRPPGHIVEEAIALFERKEDAACSGVRRSSLRHRRQPRSAPEVPEPTPSPV